MLAKDWQMEKMGYTYSEAHVIWDQLKPVIIELTKKKAEELKDRIEKGSSGAEKGDQLELIYWELFMLRIDCFSLTKQARTVN